MTLREIDICLKKICKRQKNAFAMRASLHGIKLPMDLNEDEKVHQVRKEDGDKAEKLMQEAIKNRGLKKKKDS